VSAEFDVAPARATGRVHSDILRPNVAHSALLRPKVRDLPSCRAPVVAARCCSAAVLLLRRAFFHQSGLCTR
jgi:hypothetical protein